MNNPMPINQDGQTTCPECGGSGRMECGQMHNPGHWHICNVCHGTGTVPSEPGLGSLPESPQTQGVTEELASDTGKSGPDTDTAAADPQGPEVQLVKSAGYYHLFVDGYHGPEMCPECAMAGTGFYIKKLLTQELKKLQKNGHGGGNWRRLIEMRLGDLE